MEMCIIATSNYNVHPRVVQQSHNFSDIAVFTILIVPTRAFVCNFCISGRTSFSVNPSVVMLFTSEFVTSPVAPNTIGTTVYEYSGYIFVSVPLSMRCNGLDAVFRLFGCFGRGEHIRLSQSSVYWFSSRRSDQVCCV